MLIVVSALFAGTRAFVMGGALLVTVPGFALLHRCRRTALDQPFQLPPFRQIDGKLIGGAVLFGIGWGLAGLCPGPAIAGLATGIGGVYVFVVAMLAGMVLFRFLPLK